MRIRCVFLFFFLLDTPFSFFVFFEVKSGDADIDIFSLFKLVEVPKDFFYSAVSLEITDSSNPTLNCIL